MASLSATTAAASWIILRPPWMRSLLSWQLSGAGSLYGWYASQALHCYQSPLRQRWVENACKSRILPTPAGSCFHCTQEDQLRLAALLD